MSGSLIASGLSGSQWPLINQRLLDVVSKRHEIGIDELLLPASSIGRFRLSLLSLLRNGLLTRLD